MSRSFNHLDWRCSQGCSWLSCRLWRRQIRSLATLFFTSGAVFRSQALLLATRVFLRWQHMSGGGAVSLFASTTVGFSGNSWNTGSSSPSMVSSRVNRKGPKSRVISPLNVHFYETLLALGRSPSEIDVLMLSAVSTLFNVVAGLFLLPGISFVTVPPSSFFCVLWATHASLAVLHFRVYVIPVG